MLKHIAFIMDGNGRWATSRGLPRLEGHRKGVEAVRCVIDKLVEEQIPYATFYAFSTENWNRPNEEVSGLMGLIKWYFKSELATLMEKNIRVRVIGDRSKTGKLPADVIKILNAVEEKTAQNTGITATFAINYGGRNEILRAAQKLASCPSVTEEKFEEMLDTKGLPNVDVLVRTSGEKRISNFLLWQASYAELYFSNTLWPEFGAEEVENVLTEFSGRDRRFGALNTKTA